MNTSPSELCAGVLHALRECKVTRRMVTDEANVERRIAEYLQMLYPVTHRQYNIGGYLGLKIDLDINNGAVGIEIKLTRNLKGSGDIQRMFGQAIYYSRRRYGPNLIFCFVGPPADFQAASFLEVSGFINELGLLQVFIVTE